MTEIEITRPHPEFPDGTKVVVDGLDVSLSLSRVDVTFDGSHAPVVTFGILGVETFRMCSPDAELVIDDATADMLVRHGWKRP